MNDYILKCVVFLDQHDLTGTTKKSEAYFKWVRFPQCPQLGWLVWDGREVEEIELCDGVFYPIVEILGRYAEDEREHETFRLEIQGAGFAPAGQFDFSGPPR